MSTMQSEVLEALRAIDTPEDKALKAATALSRRDEDVADLKSDARLLKWMTETSIGLTLILLGTVLTLLSRIGEISRQKIHLAQRIH